MPTATVLFGAFDRHNFGDMLFPHVTARMMDAGPFVFAGLVERDFRPLGGHHVLAINDVISRAGQPIKLMHAGGELLGCDAWEAAVMVSDTDEADQVVRRLDHHPAERAEWARKKLSCNELVPYLISRSKLPEGSSVHFNAVGGVDIDARDPLYRMEVLSKLGHAESISVRDRHTQSILEHHGIQAALSPDPAVMVASLFQEEITSHYELGEVLKVRQLHPQGYVVVQCSADYDDDASLDLIAAQLEQVCTETGFGCVFFRAGAAPWHDSLGCLSRIAKRIRQADCYLFQSLNLWDICALLASGRLVCASSLHARILAMAFALPRVTFRHQSGKAAVSKHDAYLATWEYPDLAQVVRPTQIAVTALHALQANPETLSAHACSLSDCYRRLSP